MTMTRPELINRVDWLTPGPVDVPAEAARAATDDPGSMSLLSEMQAIHLIRSITRRHRDAPAVLAERVDASPRCQNAIDGTGSRMEAIELDVEATSKGFTVPFCRDREPMTAVLACLIEDGRRDWGVLDAPDQLAQLLNGDPTPGGVRRVQGAAEVLAA